VMVIGLAVGDVQVCSIPSCHCIQSREDEMKISMFSRHSSSVESCLAQFSDVGRSILILTDYLEF
jgi:hypothetical protein